MLGFLKFIPKQYAIIALCSVLIVTHCFAYYKGYKSAENKANVALVKQYEKERKYLKTVDDLSRQLVKAHAEKTIETKIVYRTIKKGIPNATTGAVCLNDVAGKLWNDALRGDMPVSSPRATDTPSRTYTDELVITNAVDNFEQYTACRAQLNALIDWHEKVETINASK
jgi:hypothetical protein